MARINTPDPALLLDRICERFDLRKKKKAYHFHRVKIDNDHDFNRYLKNSRK